jgi:hypothetical protein
LKGFSAYGDRFKNLRKVLVLNNNITDEGFEAFARNLEKFKNLSSVNFGEN